MSIIADVLGSLHDSHTVFYPPERMTRVRYGWRAAIVGDTPYIVGVTAGSDAEAEGLAVGDRLLQWNGTAPDRSNLQHLTYVYRFVAPRVAHHFVVEEPDRTLRRIDVSASLSMRPPAQEAGALIEDLAEAFSPREPDRDFRVGDVLVWQLHAFVDGAAIERVMKKAAAARALVLDLRGNGGGSIHAMEELISHLFTADVPIAVVRTRGGEDRMTAKGRRDAFSGPIAVLVDSGTASASEMAARVIQLERRGTVLGDRTAGAVMTSRVISHTIGIGSISFYAESITIGDVRMRDGAPLEGRGVTPDLAVLPTPRDLASGLDPALARAIEVLRIPALP